MSITRVTSVKKRQGWTYDSGEKIWYSYKIDLRVGGVRHRDAGFKTRKKAEEAIAELKAGGVTARLGLSKAAAPITLKELFQKRLDRLKETKRVELESRVLNYFLEVVGEKKRVIDLTVSDLRSFVDKRSAEKSSRDAYIEPSTVNRELTVISSAIKQAGEYYPELENFNPPRIPRIKNADKRRTRVISKNESEKLLAHFARVRQPNESDSHYRDRLRIGQELEFALLTSSRRKEVMKLKWSDYFPDQDLLKITRWKTIKSKADSVTMFSPLPVRVRELLEIRRKTSEGEYIFSDTGNERQGYLKSMKRACKALGIPYGRHTDGGITFHDSRHTFVSGLLDSGIDLETTRELAGLSRDMILRYAHSSPDAKKRAVGVLDGGKGVEKLTEIYHAVRDDRIKLNEFIEVVLSL